MRHRLPREGSPSLRSPAAPGSAPGAETHDSLGGSRLSGRSTGPFHYRDKGNLATIGRGRAVADLHVIRLSGLVAWVTWLVVHIWYLIGFQNRLLVILRWAFSFMTRGRGARLITDQPPPGEPSKPGV